MSMKIKQICPALPFGNGASPCWSMGNSAIIRVGSRVFATNSRVHPERKPLNNTTLEIWEKEDGGEWRMVYEDPETFQREPCPIAYPGNNVLAVSVNVPARFHAPDEATEDRDCIPMLYLFDISGSLRKTGEIRLKWDQGDYAFWEHSYRGFAYDSVRGNLFLNNIEYSGDDQFCFTLLNSEMQCIKTGKLHFPERCCYHAIAMKDGETYLFGVRDIKEPNAEWRDYKRSVTGREWDYDFRQLYLNYCPDIEAGDFEPSLLICDMDSTCGWTFPLDCCYDANGDMFFLASVRNITPPFMQERFFPELAHECTLELYRFSKGKLIAHRQLATSAGTEPATGYNGFFHTAASGEVYAVWCKNASSPQDPLSPGTYLSRLSAPDAPPVRLMDECAATFGSKVRLGAAPSDRVDLYWSRDDRQIMHAEFDLPVFP